MNMLADYFKQRENVNYHEIENVGFLTWKLQRDNSVYIIDIYVKPEYRKTGIASKMADSVIKACNEQNIHTFWGTVDTTIGEPTESMKVLLAYGFKIDHINDQTIWLRKDTKNDN